MDLAPAVITAVPPKARQQRTVEQALMGRQWSTDIKAGLSLIGTLVSSREPNLASRYRYRALEPSRTQSVEAKDLGHGEVVAAAVRVTRWWLRAAGVATDAGSRDVASAPGGSELGARQLLWPGRAYERPGTKAMAAARRRRLRQRGAGGTTDRSHRGRDEPSLQLASSLLADGAPSRRRHDEQWPRRFDAQASYYGVGELACCHVDGRHAERTTVASARAFWRATVVEQSRATNAITDGLSGREAERPQSPEPFCCRVEEPTNVARDSLPLMSRGGAIAVAVGEDYIVQDRLLPCRTVGASDAGGSSPAAAQSSSAMQDRLVPYPRGRVTAGLCGHNHPYAVPAKVGLSKQRKRTQRPSRFCHGGIGARSSKVKILMA
ncbi:hypothetical protein PR202_gb12900 [Eleusine coracana subsp. coracana]|uniref:Uncharacterized protein n=1 Tax=Eleusine coracana subsp. coracana TaxID=191504 RepID=A0AAV5EQT6_ELECO|nr:hypothetical protein PR202_gb12900 [Eleusine coracana subsp. coracana]